MMTLTELSTAAKNPDPAFVARVTGACLLVAARVAREATSVAGHAAKVSWATRVFQAPEIEGKKMAAAVLGHFTDLTVAAVYGQPDEKVQQAVTHCVGGFAYTTN